MSTPKLLVSPRLGALRRHVMETQVARSELGQLPTVFVAGYGAVRGWRKVTQKYFSQSNQLPRFQMLEEYFRESVQLNADNRLSFISPSQRALTLRSLLTFLKPELSALSGLADSNNFLAQINRWLSLLFEANVQSWPADGGPWSEDLQRILSAYQQWQKKQSITLKDQEFAGRLFAESQNDTLSVPQHVIIDNAVANTPNIQAGLKKLIHKSTFCTVILAVPGYIPDSINWPSLRRFVAGSALEYQLDFWQRQNADLQFVPCEGAAQSHNVEDIRSLAASPKVTVTVNEQHTPRREIITVARSIRETAKTAQQASHKTVITNNVQRYGELIKSTFNDFGIGVQRSLGRPAIASPLVARFVQLLRLQDGGWKVADFIDIFSGEVFTFSSNEHALQIQRLETAMVYLRQPRLDDVAQLVNQIDRLIQLQNTDLEWQEIKRDLYAVQSLQKQLQEIAASNNVTIWQELILSLLDQLTSHWCDATDEEQKQIALDLIEILRSAARAVAQHNTQYIHKSQDGNIWLDQLLLLLAAPQSDWQQGVRVGVSVMAPRSLTEDVPPVIYWPGMSEGDIPKPQKEALAQRHQKTLQKLCPQLCTPLQESTYWLALALSEAREVHFSYPNICEGNVSLKSFFITQINDHATPSQKNNAIEKYYSRYDWQRYLASAVTIHSSTFNTEKYFWPKVLLEMHSGRHGLALDEYDGTLDTFAPPSQITHSAHSLRLYAECGLKYFFEKVLLLPESDRYELMPNKRESGSFIHEIFEQFYTQFNAPLSAEHQDAAWKLLQKIATDVVQKLHLSPLLKAIHVRELIGDNSEKPHGMLGNYLLEQVRLRKDNFAKSPFAQPMEPLRLSSFVLPKSLQRSVEAKFKADMNGMSITGKFDRLDINTDNNAVVAVDYKTGSVPSSKDAPNGLDFQLPLYLWALQKVLLEAHKDVSVGGIFYSLTDQKYTAGISQAGVLNAQGRKGDRGTTRPLDQESWDNLQNELITQVETINRLTQTGNFPISVRDRKDAGCKYCRFKNICYRDDALQQSRQAEMLENRDIYTEGITPPQTREPKEQA